MGRALFQVRTGTISLVLHLASSPGSHRRSGTTYYIHTYIIADIFDALALLSIQLSAKLPLQFIELSQRQSHVYRVLSCQYRGVCFSPSKVSPHSRLW